jgi:alkanesulfonate monooxygenase SsuD/methylene tetrahydromethanopterin reductase-like flavin-dependent oxidoreductase (luciferase family)
MPSTPQEILVVATRTAPCTALVNVLADRAQRSPARFHLLVPATPYGWGWLADMHSGGVDAARYLGAAITRYRSAGLVLGSARIGDPDPMAAAMDELAERGYDAIVVSTLPRHLSDWLRMSLPHRLRAVTGLPVTHVVGTQARLTPRAHSYTKTRARLRAESAEL